MAFPETAGGGESSVSWYPPLFLFVTGVVDAKTPIPVNIVRGTHPQLIAYLVLNVWPSHFGLPVLLAIVLFSKRVQRHPTFVNLSIVFIAVGM